MVLCYLSVVQAIAVVPCHGALIETVGTVTVNAVDAVGDLIIYPLGSLTGILTGHTNQTTSQFNVTLGSSNQTAVTNATQHVKCVTEVDGQFGFGFVRSVIKLCFVITEIPKPMPGPFANITSTLANASAVYTSAATQVTQNSTTDTAGLDFIVQIVGTIYGTINDTITQVTPIIGTTDVQNDFQDVLQGDLNVTAVGFTLFNTPLPVYPNHTHHERHRDHSPAHQHDNSILRQNCHRCQLKYHRYEEEYHRYEAEYHHYQILVVNFTEAVAGWFNAAFDMVITVQEVAASAAANNNTASNDLIEAINALVVILGSTLQVVLIGLDKTAEIVTEIPQPSLLILTVATNGVNGAVQNMTSLVNQTSSALSNSTSTTAPLSGSVQNIASSLATIVTYLSNHSDIINSTMTKFLRAQHQQHVTLGDDVNDCSEAHEDYNILSDNRTTTHPFVGAKSTNCYQQYTPGEPITVEKKTTFVAKNSSNQQHQQQIPAPPNTSGTPVYRKRGMNNDDMISILQTICGQFADTNETDDEDSYFVKSIELQMRKINDEEKFQFKMNVLQLAHDAVNNSK